MQRSIDVLAFGLSGGKISHFLAAPGPAPMLADLLSIRVCGLHDLIPRIVVAGAGNLFGYLWLIGILFDCRCLH